MSEDDPSAPLEGQKVAAKPPNGEDKKKATREARLAAALRENLRRRKVGNRKPETGTRKD